MSRMTPDEPGPVARWAKVLGALVAVRAALGAARRRKPVPPPPAPESEFDPAGA